MLGLICIVGKRVSIGYSCLSGTYMQHIWIKLEPRPFCALQSMPLGQEYASIHARGSPTMVGSLSACHSSSCSSPYYLHHSHCPLHLDHTSLSCMICKYTFPAFLLLSLLDASTAHCLDVICPDLNMEENLQCKFLAWKWLPTLKVFSKKSSVLA